MEPQHDCNRLRDRLLGRLVGMTAAGSATASTRIYLPPPHVTPPPHLTLLSNAKGSNTQSRSPAPAGSDSAASRHTAVN
eukprot:361635-Chlamydomonas_euryale.AAC.6